MTCEETLIEVAASFCSERKVILDIMQPQRNDKRAFPSKLFNLMQVG